MFITLSRLQMLCLLSVYNKSIYLHMCTIWNDIYHTLMYISEAILRRHLKILVVKWLLYTCLYTAQIMVTIKVCRCITLDITYVTAKILQLKFCSWTLGTAYCAPGKSKTLDRIQISGSPASAKLQIHIFIENDLTFLGLESTVGHRLPFPNSLRHS